MIKKFKPYFSINESVSIQGFKIIPEGSSIPKSGIVKFGIDPTMGANSGGAGGLHLGHFIPMRMVKKLKEFGMKVVIVLGSFSAQIGDPSGRSEMRPMLSFEQTLKNAESLIPQIKKIIGDDIEIRFNHEWFNEMKLPEMMSILSKFTAEYLMSRDSFQKRKEAGGTLAMSELIVPILQGIDSYELKADLEIGGTDQFFNMLLSRDVQEKMGQKPEICLMAPILNGLDGKKMSKTFNNCIYLNDSPKDVFGKAMSIPDAVMYEWYPLFFDSYDDNKHPMILKKDLAEKITDEIWPGKGSEERASFENTFQKKEVPTDMVKIEATNLLDFVVKLRKCSKGAARTLIGSNSVTVNNKKETDTNLPISSGDIIRVGKKDFGEVI